MTTLALKMSCLSLLAVFCILFTVPSKTQAANELVMECPEKWDMIGSHCYYFINVHLSFEESHDMCKMYGAKIVRMRDEVESMEVGRVARDYFSPGDSFWISNKREDGRTDLSDFHYGYWQIEEPNLEVVFGPNPALVSNLEGLWAFSWAMKRHAIVCRAPACVKDMFRCNNGKCINRKWECDGTYDCEDHSDESNCPDKCTQYYTQSSGSISTGYSNSAYCKWTIEADPWRILRLDFTLLDLEKDVDILTISAGGPSLDTSYVLETLTGPVIPEGSGRTRTFYSHNNYLIIELRSDASITGRGFDASWSAVTSINRGHVNEIRATESSQELVVPFQNNGPRYLTTEWDIRADEGEIITVEMMTEVNEDLIIITSMGIRIDLPEEKRLVSISNGDHVQLVVKTEGEQNRGFVARVWAGCNVDMQATYFTVESNRKMPHYHECAWKFTNSHPKGDAKFKVVANSIDLRAGGQLDVYDGDMKVTSLETIRNYFVGDVSDFLFMDFGSGDSRGGMRLNVTTRCPDFPELANLLFVNDSKTVDHDPTYNVNFTCQEGYSFAQEGFVDQVTGHCSPSGKWTFLNATETRYPSCQEIHCGAPPQIDFGFINGTDGSVKYAGEATYLCANGFSMDGSNTVSCQADGTWSDPPVCLAASCSPYVNPTDAEMVYEHGDDDHGFGTVIKLECNTGFELVGAERVICLKGGEWSSTNSYCENLRCSIPRIHRGAYVETHAIPYGKSGTFSCDKGYKIYNSSEEIVSPVCKYMSTGDFYDVMCVDIDECENEDACPSNKDCVNIPGSFECICKREYNVTDDCKTLLVDHYPHCYETSGGGVACDCPDGFELFTKDGQNGYQIPSEEDGLVDGDVLRINRTCIRKTCRLPTSTGDDYPIPLTDRTHVYFQDTVHWICPPNFQPIQPIRPTTCGSDSVLNPGFQCARFTCMVNENFRKTIATTVIDRFLNVGESGTIQCYSDILGRKHPRDRHVFCTIDPQMPMYTLLQGDASWCPSINCPYIDLPGIEPSIIQQGETGDFVTVICDGSRGFTLAGDSAISSSQPLIECRNGSWSLGSLRCEGPRCGAPATSAGTRQVNPESYAIDTKVYYECINPTLTLKPPGPLTCIYDSTEGVAVWNGSPPSCWDDMLPIIDCPGPQYFDLYDVIELDRPITAEDNIHTHVGISQPIGPLLGVSRISEDTKMGFQAMDHWDVSVCEVDVLLNDRSAPDLICGNDRYFLDTTGDRVVFNTSDLEIITQYPELLRVEPSGMVTIMAGESVVITASVVKENTLMKSCGFVVTASNASCVESRPLDVAHGMVEDCFTVSKYSCPIDCHDHYVLPGSETGRLASCANRHWDFERSYYNCYPTQPPVKRVHGELYYDSPTPIFALATNCQTAFNSAVKSSFESISGLCVPYTFKMEDMSISLVSFVRAKFEFTLIIGNYDENEDSLQACIASLLVGKSNYFVPSNLPVTAEFNSCSFPWSIQTLDAEKLEPQDSSCGPRQEMKEIANTMRCVPCLPGHYWDASLQRCKVCTDGTYTTEMDMLSCDHTCANDGGGLLAQVAKDGITSEEGCPEFCPIGYTARVDGLISSGCVRCPEDEYWVDAKTCVPCPNAGSTKGKTASTLGDCKDACPMGTYSISGFEPCTPCPINFYQSSMRQTSCKRCGHAQTTLNMTGATTNSDCIDFECDPLLCNDEGVNKTNPCFEDYHNTICSCNKDYYGTHCEHKHDRCNPNPCYNEGECVPTDEGFECRCPQDETCTFTTEPLLDYGSRPDSINNIDLEACKNSCEEKGSGCVAIIFESLGSLSICWIYPELLLTSTANEHGDMSMRKTCAGIALFTGQLCQHDEVDDCQDDTCSERDFCRDLVNDAECICPPGVAYTDKNRCVKAADPCSAVTCMNGGACVAYGDVRFNCECMFGFTGELCETNIDDCSQNTCIFGGTCVDRLNDHSCICTEGRSGKNCEVVDYPVCDTPLCRTGTCHTYYVNSTLTPICACGDDEEWPSDSAKNMCTIINHCESSPCKNDGSCVSTVGGYKCNCPDNYWGAQCQHGGDDCTANSCLNGGICRDQHNSFTCDCPSGYRGLQCQFNINDCTDSPCENGQCIDLVHDYSCDCQPGYGGRNCSDILNMCDDHPCRHGGNCTSLGVNSYRCDCMEGFNGDDCQNRINLCQEDVCQNDATCYNLIDRPYCRCKEGTAGDTCEIKTDMCELFGSFLCVNGKCENGDDGNAQCVCAGEITSCDIKLDLRVEFTPSFMETPSLRSLQSCKDLCLSKAACKALIYSGGLCALYDHLQLMTAEGVTQFAGVKECQFDPHYSGDSCELQKDVCHDNPCGVDDDNMGMCSVSGLGYKCDCDKVDNYKGARCQTPVEVCQPSTCPSGIQCRTYMDRHGKLMPACVCQPNEVMAGSRCKDIDNDFDLIFPLPDKDGDDDDDDDKIGKYATSARGFFTGDTGEMTVALWVACLEEPEDWILSIAESDQNPDAGREGYVAMLELYNEDFFTHRHHENQTKISLETDLSEDYSWHFIAISLDAQGRYQLVQDYNTYAFDTEGHTIDFMIPLDTYMFVHLGHKFSGYISQVHVWNSVVPLNQLLNVLVDPLSVPSPSSLALSWSLYRHDKSVTPVRPSLVKYGVSVCSLPTTVVAALEHCGDDAVDAAVDKKPPKVRGRCEKEVFLTPHNESNQVTLGRLNVNFDGGVTVNNVPTNALSFGAYDVVFASTDMEGNVGICMTRVQVSGLKEKCAFPEGPNVVYQDFTTQHRVPNCKALSSSRPSVPVANQFTCGKLRSYNYRDIYQLPNRVVCGAPDNVYITLKVNLVYNIGAPCSVIDVDQSFKNQMNSDLRTAYSNNWALCDSSDCSSARITTNCNPSNSFQMLIQIVLPDLSAYFDVMVEGEVVTYSPEQAMQYLVQTGAMDASSIVNADLQVDLTRYNSTTVCRHGRGRRGENMCVGCGPGSFYSGSPVQECKLCPFGTFSNESGTEECLPCGEGKTTLYMGSNSMDDCIEACAQGEAISESGECAPCRQGFYQSETGQDQCLPCPPATGTDGVGARSIQGCIAFCAPGKELIGRVCVNCKKGFYRIGNLQDRCKPCPTNYTTISEASSDSGQCNIPLCPAGSHVIGEGLDMDCEECAYGTYQPHEAQFDCMPCDRRYTTNHTMSTNASDCIFVCPAGFEQDGPTFCSKCPRGHYKEDTLEDRFEMCHPCPDVEFTTEKEGAVNSSQCVVRRCNPGYYYNKTDNWCYDCPRGTYQAEEQMDSCEPCQTGYNTRNESSVSDDACEFVCGEGSQVDDTGAACEVCPRGTYKNKTMIFGACRMCDNGMSTLSNGAVSSEECTVAICPAGHIVSDDHSDCVECSLDHFQPQYNPLATVQCTRCTGQTGTNHTGATSDLDCLNICFEGQGNVGGSECVSCPRGQWNNGNETMRFEECHECPTDLTTEVSQGATSLDFCNMPYCMAGQVVVDNKCSLCPVDHYQPSDHPLLSTVCEQCPPGEGTMFRGSVSEERDCDTFCVPGNGFYDEVGCTLCARGTWNNGNLTMRWASCEPCPVGYTTAIESGATDKAECSIRDCQPGSFFDRANGDACTSCPIGSFQSEPRKDKCENCPINKNTSFTGSDSMADCLVYCSAGTEDDGDANCVPCQADYFKAKDSFSECLPCEGDVTSEVTNRKACTKTHCDVGRFKDGASCRDCDQGYYKGVRGNEACVMCPGNTTTPEAGATSDSMCSVTFCEPGFFSPDGTGCSPCQVGFFKEDRGNDVCTRCEGAFTTSGEAATKQSDCDLPICQAGNIRVGKECSKCPKGTFQSEDGMTECVNCDAGYTTMQTGSTDNTQCRRVCPAGQYRMEVSNTCKLCGLGHYQSEEGQTECDQCPGNHTTFVEDASSEDQCYVLCPVGYHRSGRTQCTPCATGRFQNMTGQAECQVCPDVDGYPSSTLNEASENLDQCLPLCTQGLYLVMEDRRCEDCSIGTFSETIGLETECETCREGTTTLTTQSKNENDCSYALCDKGYYRQPNQQDCQMCGYGTYQPLGDTQVTECTACGNGKTSLVLGATTDEYCLKDCADGEEFNQETQECTPCAIGQYRKKPDLMRCYYCKDGETTLTVGSSSCIATDVPPSPVVPMTFSSTMFFGANSCQNQDHIHGVIRAILKSIFRTLARRYTGLCRNRNCDNLVIEFVGDCGPRGGNVRRKKRQASSGDVETGINVSDVDSRLTDTQTGQQVDPETVIQDALRDMTTQQDTLEANGLTAPAAITVDVACQQGSLLLADQKTCEPCAVGTYHKTDSDTCVDVPKGSYTDSAGSTTYKDCPTGMTTAGTGSTSVGDCDGLCSADDTYCVHGTCEAGANGKSACVCHDYYKGTKCDEHIGRAAIDDDNEEMIGGIAGGIGAVLFVILIIVACFAFKFKSRRSSKRRSDSSDSDSIRELKSQHGGGGVPYVMNPVFSSGGHQAVMVQDPTMYRNNQMDYFHPIYHNNPNSQYEGNAWET